MRSFFRGRIGAMLALLLSLTFVVGAAGWWYTRSLAADLQILYRENLQGSNHLANAERGLWELRFALPNYFLGDVEARPRIAAEGDKLFREVNDNIKEYAALDVSPEERELVQKWEQ